MTVQTYTDADIENEREAAERSSESRSPLWNDRAEGSSWGIPVPQCPRTLAEDRTPGNVLSPDGPTAHVLLQCVLGEDHDGPHQFDSKGIGYIDWPV